MLAGGISDGTVEVYRTVRWSWCNSALQFAIAPLSDLETPAMAKPTIVFGLILIGLGLFGYLGSEPKAPTAEAIAAAEAAGEEAPKPARSKTAMIPVLFGFPLLICGTLALNEKWLKHAMHGAAMVGLVGALGGLIRGIMVLAKGGDDINMRAVTFSLLLGAICAVFVFLCVKSFIATRKRREASEAQAVTE